jgi:hypothetical protein
MYNKRHVSVDPIGNLREIEVIWKRKNAMIGQLSLTTFVSPENPLELSVILP